MFVAKGFGIKSGKRFNAEIIDLAPTVLHIFGLSIPKDMNRKVLKEIFEEGSELAKREVKYQEVGEKGRVKDRIKVLREKEVV